MNMYRQLYKIPSVLMRGGTSKGLILKDHDLPEDEEVREKVISSIFGSSANGQIDGVGGGTPLTSKLAIVGPSNESAYDIFYKFGQVSVSNQSIDYKVTCGNMASAVGLFALEEGMATLKEPVTTVKILNTNTNRIMEVDIEVKDGKIVRDGDFKISGVSGTAAPIMVNFLDFGGSITGSTLPTGNPVDSIKLDDGFEVEVSILDVGNILVFVAAKDFGLEGYELSDVFNFDTSLKNKIEKVRVKCGRLLGLFDADEHVTPETHALPKIVLISSARDYIDENDEQISVKDINIVGRYIAMGTLHRAFAVSGAIGLGVAGKIPGTIPNKFMKENHEGSITIGHPTGSILVNVKLSTNNGKWVVEKAGIGRTARRLMDGNAYVPFEVTKNLEMGKLNEAY